MHLKIVNFNIHNTLSTSENIDSSKPCECFLTIEVYTDQLIVCPELQLTDGAQHISLFHAGQRNNFSVVLNRGIHTFVCKIAPLSLYSGEYFVNLVLSSPGTPLDYIEGAHRFQVEYHPAEGQTIDMQKNSFNGFVYIDYNWNLQNEENNHI